MSVSVSLGCSFVSSLAFLDCFLGFLWSSPQALALSGIGFLSPEDRPKPGCGERACVRTRVCVCVCSCVCLRLVIQPPRDPSGRRQARIKMRRFRLRFLSRPQTKAPQRVRCPGVTRGRAAGQAGLSLSPSSVSFNGGLFPLCSCSLFYWPMGSYQKPLLVSPEDFLFQAPSYLGVS